MPGAKEASLLVVDDDSSMREMLKLILSREGYQIAGEASNGQDAVMKSVSLKPDMVLLDIVMPKMDGMQALEEIRKANPDTLVMMVSAHATLDKVKEALEKGAVGFIVKPLNPASVLDRISRCLKGRKKG